ncbi:hypothetical protein PC110_g2679 [Phytophthora cactorum]|uniref:Uncharacterized protein n=1 Tax=Phytophthora cactorum TaxID=29920 RepID=A0A329SWD4_9STRA|nr:hypothetical protein PC112_g2113 [Phytophthora cactorum]KAG3194749.1 hypothetical protein PC128_g9104 [Phytophthora cactorum]RAW41074.1 hypothetical protein PC110_g2679 [Phytophthora cactorum]
MSRPSSSSSSTWTQCSDANWTMTRKSDTAVLQPPALSTLRVTLVTAEPAKPHRFPNAANSAHKNRGRFQNWCKASFQWCVKALTLCCLRQPKRSSYTEICRGPALGSKPTISTNARGNSSSIEYVPIQSPYVSQSRNQPVLLPVQMWHLQMQKMKMTI